MHFQFADAQGKIFFYMNVVLRKNIQKKDFYNDYGILSFRRIIGSSCSLMPIRTKDIVSHS